MSDNNTKKKHAGDDEEPSRVVKVLKSVDEFYELQDRLAPGLVINASFNFKTLEFGYPEDDREAYEKAIDGEAAPTLESLAARIEALEKKSK